MKAQRTRSSEKRGEGRDTTTGSLSLVFADTNATSGLREVRGRLLDRSARGFRAEHSFPGLTCGQMVQYQLPAAAAGSARVAWTRIVGGHVESGFLILP